MNLDDEFPEHTKQKLVRDDAQVIGEFLEWCGRRGVSLMTIDNTIYGERYAAATIGIPHEDGTRSTTIEAILATYFDIDLNKIEAERTRMLAKLRSAHEEPKIMTLAEYKRLSNTAMRAARSKRKDGEIVGWIDDFDAWVKCKEMPTQADWDKAFRTFAEE